MYAEILEELSSDPKGPLMRTGIGKASFTGEEDGRPVPLNPQVPAYLRGMPPVFVLDATNKMRERSDRNLGNNIAASLREQIQDAYTQLCNSIEAVALPMPNRLVQPMESWPTQVPILLRTGKGARSRRSEPHLHLRGNAQSARNAKRASSPFSARSKAATPPTLKKSAATSSANSPST